MNAFERSSESAGGPVEHRSLSAVHIWRCEIDHAPGALEAGAILSAAERARAQRLRFSDDRTRFEIGRATLRRLLAAYADETASSLDLFEGRGAKPRLADEMALWFNASGSEGLMLVAISRAGEVGVDIETLRAIPESEAITQREFTNGERDYVAGTNDAGRLSRFLTVWTRKEALVKATGLGLSQPLREFDCAPGTIGDAEVELADELWIVRDLALGRPTHVGAIAVGAAATGPTIGPAPPTGAALAHATLIATG